MQVTYVGEETGPGESRQHWVICAYTAQARLTLLCIGRRRTVGRRGCPRQALKRPSSLRSESGLRLCSLDLSLAMKTNEVVVFLIRDFEDKRLPCESGKTTLAWRSELDMQGEVRLLGQRVRFSLTLF